MLTTRKFIERTKNNLFKRYPALESCKYKFDSLTNTHYFLIPELVYSDKNFSEFDYLSTSDAFELGIQGLLCFITDEKVFDFKNQETFYNPYNNEALLKNLANIVHPGDFFSLEFNITGINLTFSSGPENVGMEVSGESNYAIAA